MMEEFIMPINMEYAGMTRVFLGGMLGKMFGKLWYLSVKSPAEAIRALDMNTKRKFGDYFMKEGRSKYYKVSVYNKHNTITKDELKSYTGDMDIYIAPVVRGASNVVRIIIGIILIIVGIVIYAYGGDGTALVKFGVQLIIAGVSLVIGGIVGLLTPIPTTPNNNDGSNLGSNLFSGNGVAIAQGIPVALVYGRSLVTPVPIAVSLDNYDQSVSGGGTTTGNPGGFVGYDGRVYYDNEDGSGRGS